MSSFQNSPYIVELEKGEDYFWCPCGKTTTPPFCDGSHYGTEIAPLSFTAEKTGAAPLCGCGRTANPPYCDGVHKTL